MKKVSGVDGCGGGWLAFHFNGEDWSENLFRNINELYRESDSELILIDIPICCSMVGALRHLLAGASQFFSATPAIRAFVDILEVIQPAIRVFMQS